MNDEERNVFLGKYRELQEELVRVVLRWFVIGILTGIIVWEGAK